MLSTKQVCEKHILLQRNRYFKHLKKPMASFSVVPGVRWVGFLSPGVSSSGSYMHILLFMTHLWGLALLLETAILFGNKCICTCRKSVRKGLLWKHFFPPSETLSHTASFQWGSWNNSHFDPNDVHLSASHHMAVVTAIWNLSHLKGTSSLDCN